MQLKIDALKEAAAWPGAGPAHPRRARHQLMAAEPYQEGHPPARLYAGRRPGQRKGNAMNTQSPYPDAEVPGSPASCPRANEGHGGLVAGAPGALPVVADAQQDYARGFRAAPLKRGSKDVGQ